MKEILSALCVMAGGLFLIVFGPMISDKINETYETVAAPVKKIAYEAELKDYAMDRFENDEEFRVRVLVDVWDIEHHKLMRNIRYVTSRDFKTAEDREEAVKAQVKYLRRIDEMMQEGYYPNALILVTDTMTAGPVPGGVPGEDAKEWCERRVWWPGVQKNYFDMTKGFGIAGQGERAPDQTAL